MTTPSARETVIGDLATVELAAGPYTARFLPGLGMVGSSFTHAGDELVRFGAGDLRAGHPRGIPLLHPWANRLSRLTYEVGGLWVDLDDTPPVHVRDGLPIHGTMLAAEGWQVEAVLADSTRALLQARFVFGNHPRHLRSFPFPHELVVFVELSDLGLRIATEVRNTGVRDVPVSFGWHPVFELPGAERRHLTLELPDRERIELDGRGLPTGAGKHEAASVVVLGDGSRARTFDDCYRLPPPGKEPAVVALAGAGRRVEVVPEDGYGHVQVYAPPGSTAVAVEPMTAPVDALVSGDHRVVPPGACDRATFVVRVSPVTDEEPQP